jgi:hypothetical protein
MNMTTSHAQLEERRRTALQYISHHHHQQGMLQQAIQQQIMQQQQQQQQQHTHTHTHTHIQQQPWLGEGAYTHLNQPLQMESQEPKGFQQRIACEQDQYRQDRYQSTHQQYHADSPYAWYRTDQGQGFSQGFSSEQQGYPPAPYNQDRYEMPAFQHSREAPYASHRADRSERFCSNYPASVQHPIQSWMEGQAVTQAPLPAPSHLLYHQPHQYNQMQSQALTQGQYAHRGAYGY